LLLASTVGGDVVYAVVIALDEQPEGLRLGMSAEVQIATEWGARRLWVGGLDLTHVQVG
jgi:hypothetical protein